MIVQTKTLIDFSKGLKFTESPRWHDDRLWFLDIHDKSIKSVNVEGDLNTVVELPFIPNGFKITKDGKVLVGTHNNAGSTDGMGQICKRLPTSAAWRRSA
jgi:sugar lactone lactonase YvrE